MAARWCSCDAAAVVAARTGAADVRRRRAVSRAPTNGADRGAVPIGRPGEGCRPGVRLEQRVTWLTSSGGLTGRMVDVFGLSRAGATVAWLPTCGARPRCLDGLPLPHCYHQCNPKCLSGLRFHVSRPREICWRVSMLWQLLQPTTSLGSRTKVRRLPVAAKPGAVGRRNRGYPRRQRTVLTAQSH